jgi:hypothetical protein
LLARGEPTQVAEAMATRYAPQGATVHIERADGLITVTVRARSRLPIPLFSNIGSRSMNSTSVAVQESP